MREGLWARAIGMGSARQPNSGTRMDCGATLPTCMWDESGYTIRKIVLATGEVTTFAGFPSSQGYADGIGSDGQFYGPTGVWGDGTNLFVADRGGIRKVVTSTRAVTTSP